MAARKNQKAQIEEAEKEEIDSSSPASSADALTFEDAIERVEAIVREMEGDRVPLDSLLKHYEEGNRLLRLCQKRIEEAQARIEIIAAGEDGDPIAIEFEAVSARSEAGRSAAPSSPSDAAEEDEEFESENDDDHIRLF